MGNDSAVAVMDLISGQLYKFPVERSFDLGFDIVIQIS